MSPASPSTPQTSGPNPVRRTRRGLVIAAVTVVILIVGLIVADIAARAYVRSRVGDELRTALAIEPGARIDVEVRGFSMLAQLARGRLERVDVSTGSVTFGNLNGSLAGTVIGLPIDQAKPVSSLSFAFSVGEDQLEKLSANLSGLPITSVALTGSEIRFDAAFTVFGVSVPLGVGVEPAAVNGQLAFTPSSVTVNGATLPADELRQLFGSAAKTALQTRAFCVAQYLPSAFELRTTDIRDRKLVLTFAAENAVLGGNAVPTKGACPAA